MALTVTRFIALQLAVLSAGVFVGTVLRRPSTSANVVAILLVAACVVCSLVYYYANS